MKPVLLIVAFSAALFGLAGCAHEPTQTVREECLGYGFESGTAPYLDCITKRSEARAAQDERKQQDRAALAAQQVAIIQHGQQQNQLLYQQQMNAINQNYQTYRQNRSVTTNCMAMGNSISCTSY